MYRNVYMQDTSEIYTENEESNDRRFIGLVNMSTSISYAKYLYIYIGLRYRCYFIVTGLGTNHFIIGGGEGHGIFCS